MKHTSYFKSIFLLLLLSCGFSFSQPANYYTSANGLTGAPLKTALYTIIKDHTVISYTNLWTAFNTTDIKPSTSNVIWDIYTDIPQGTPVYQFIYSTDQCGTYSVEGDCYNREHSMPKSWFLDASPMYSDLYHIYPTDGKVNGMRSNYPYGEVGTPTYTSSNGSKLGTSVTPGYTGLVFEPIDAYKGDLARAYFYMVTRYENLVSTWQTNDTNGDVVLNGTAYPAFESWYIDLLLQWHAQDPVSQKEIDRNNAIYALQGNRNPFVDHPEYAAAIWNPTPITLATEPTNPVSNFSAVATSTSAITVSWLDTTGATPATAYLLLASTTATFTNPIDGVSQNNSALVKNVASGVQTVTFTGLSSNTLYYFKIFPYSGSGSSINYKTDGSVPTTSATTLAPVGVPTALAASSLSSGSFTANWQAVSGAQSYRLDVYKRIAGGTATDLFFSEYVEGSSNNKYLEIFNGTGASVNLANYEILLYANGVSIPNSTNVLSGTLNHGSVLVLRNGSANLLGTLSYPISTATAFNGDDALVLFNKSTSTIVDVFGRVGEDPGTAWTSGVLTTVDKTLVRKSTIMSGVTVNPSSGFPTLATQWDLLPIDDITNLGIHTFNGGTTIVPVVTDVNVGAITSYTITGLDPATTYYYVVRAFDGTSTTQNSNEIAVTTSVTPTIWNGSSWSDGVPTATRDAVINGDLTVSVGGLTTKNLTISATTVLTIAADQVLRVQGDLVNHGSVVFESNAQGTAQFDVYGGSPIAGSGSFTVKRYITGKRAFRLLAPAVTTTGSIATNWQQQVYITGAQGAIGTISPDGFDCTATGNPSLFTYESSGWSPISNTNVLPLLASKGYRLLVRGDRTPSLLNSASQVNMNQPVTLSATGALVTGSVTYSTMTASDYTLIANPYVSPIDWATVTKTGIENSFYAWDPTLGTGTQRGRYVACTSDGITNILSDGSGASTTVSNYIQSGQAFFVKNATSGVAGSLTIKETDKASVQAFVFRNSPPTRLLSKLGITLYSSLAYSLGEPPLDGALVVQNEGFTSALDSDDVVKLSSSGEQVAFQRGAALLSIDKIGTVVPNDVFQIVSSHLQENQSYVWKVVVQHDFAPDGIVLFDTYTQQSHTISFNSTTVVTFQTTTDVASRSPHRFQFLFPSASLTVPSVATSVFLYPNPAPSGVQQFVLSGLLSDVPVHVHNVVGQVIPVQKNYTPSGLVVTPTVAVVPGIYFVTVTTDSKVIPIQWVVE
ncbi:endonuclease [Flavobacterium sp. HXWNR69]|uniref:Endonuclease n=1 Tax=Flavobacterium fragile TaxID=2949085 RepID=A0ABT0TFF5_9FLAO|nr:endonuclease [Flavobacterium sp. HXWNR69]MCL9769714.1 endonuclease [Flavobacterium sp. HXWNR69]